MNIWISTDLHLFSDEPDARHPYRTSRKLGLISDHFASSISQEDLFIFLGDLCDPSTADKERVKAIIQSIPCRKYMCRGNHDTEDELWYREVGFDEVADVIRFHNIIFSHKPLHVAPDEVNVHGHLHTQILSALGPNHINAYAANWNKDESPVLLEDLIDSATVQMLKVSEAEGNRLKSQYELYTSIDNDVYSKFLDIGDEVSEEIANEAAEDIRNAKGFYHLSEVNLDGKTLSPKVPSNFLIDGGYEDGKTKRICFAPFIDNALTAMSDNVDGKEFYVHVPDGRLTGFVHPTLKQVPDVKITKEIWALSPVKVKCIGKIKVTGYNDTAGRYKYGDNEAELCIWDWEWVDDLSEAATPKSQLQQIMEFCNWMDKNFQYGLRINGKWDPKRNTTDKDWDDYLVVQSPDEIAKSKVGVCWDYVSYEADYFKKNFPDVPFRTYYLQFFNGEDCPSHTILTFELGGKHYYFENSFRRFAGVYEASSEVDIVNYVLRLMADHPDPTLKKGELLKKWGYDVWEYNALDKGLFGLRCVPYMNYIQSNSKCWHHTYKPAGKIKKLNKNAVARTLTEATTAAQVKTLYHGSASKYQMLKAQASPAYPDRPAVFATPMYDFALAFAGNPWSDLQINQCMYNGTHVLTEILPNQFDQLFNRPGYVHVLDAKDFTPFGRASEWTCPHDVKPTRVDRIPNVLEALQKSNTTLYHYPTLPPWIPDRKAYIAEIIDKYHMTSSVEQVCKMYKINESSDVDSDDDPINEILFPDADSVEYWMADDDKFLRDLDRAKQKKEDGNNSVAIDETATVKHPSVTATETPTTNPNDKVSSTAVKLAFYNGTNEQVGEASISSVDTEFGFLYDVEVFPPYRNQGYGHAIMDYVLSNYSITELTVEKSNTIAINLYKQYGFVKKMSFMEKSVQMIDMQRPVVKPATVNETIDHTLNKQEKTQLAKKYGLTDVGNTHEYDDEKELAEMKRKAALKEKQAELDRKQKNRKRQLKQARNAKKRKAFINKVKSHLPGVKQEEASAVDNDQMDWDVSPETLFDGNTHMKKFIQESYQFQLVDKVQFFDRLDEAANKNSKYVPVYVVIMHTGTALSTAIKTVLNSQYSHASISFDSSLTNMYSFARKLSDDGKASHDGGFRTEDIRNKFFQDKEIKFSMYMVPCTEEQVKLMKKRLEYFKKNQSKFTYDFTGLIKSYFNISDNPEYRWFCTRFVADILNAGRPHDPYVKDPFLVRPDDFMETNYAMYVTTGYLSQYDKKSVDAITKRLLNQKTVQKFIQDNQNECVLDFPLDNPYNRHVLNFQLSRMDEAAVNDFIRYLQSFKVRFDANGDIRITRREYDQLDAHFRASTKMVRSCMEAGNVEGVKEELYKIHYMINLINQYYLKPYAKNYRPNAKDVRKDMMDLRAVMMSAFKQYLEWVTTREPNYNFQRGYKVSDYGSEVRIPQKLITHVGTVITTILK